MGKGWEKAEKKSEENSFFVFFWCFLGLLLLFCFFCFFLNDSGVLDGFCLGGCSCFVSLDG